MPTAAEIINLLQLQPLPNEGGYFKQTYACAPSAGALRPASTAIYFLITPDGFSALHRLETDELWHFYAGDVVEHLTLDPVSGKGVKHFLGADLAVGGRPQLVVSGGSWQGARLAPGPAREGWALLGCTMAPGWDEREFILGQRAALIAGFPAWADDIKALTR